MNSPLPSVTAAVDLIPQRNWEVSKHVKIVLKNLATVQNWSKVELSDEAWMNVLAGLKKLAQ